MAALLTAIRSGAELRSRILPASFADLLLYSSAAPLIASHPGTPATSRVHIGPQFPNPCRVKDSRLYFPFCTSVRQWHIIWESKFSSCSPPVQSRHLRAYHRGVQSLTSASRNQLRRVSMFFVCTRNTKERPLVFAENEAYGRQLLRFITPRAAWAGGSCK